MRAAWNPAKQVGWYRDRNRNIVKLFKQGMAKDAIAFKYNLTVTTVSAIIKAMGE